MIDGFTWHCGPCAWRSAVGCQAGVFPLRDRPSRCGLNNGMCNRYRATDVVMIRDVFGFTYIESGPPRYKTTGIGPWQPGPFVIPAGVRVGQWGLIPWFSKTQRPTGRGGRPISTNNCRSWCESPRAPGSR